MKKTTLLLTLPWLLFAGYSAHISPITPAVKSRMLRGHSWHQGCPVPLSNLRYLTMTYRGFDGREHTGEMIVHANVAKEVTQIFGELYRSGYPIHRMRLVSNYGGDDFASIEADNTSAFNCRAVTGGSKWSKHALGTAIDINPIENPYISHSGHIAHRKSLMYRKRAHIGSHPRSVMLRGDTIVRAFKRRGWRWGGDWHSIKDYQHFDKPGAHRGGQPHTPKAHKTRHLNPNPFIKRPPGRPVSTIQHTNRPFSYVVKSGDTVYALEKKFGVSCEEIKSLNSEITDCSDIKIGQRIRLSK